MNIDDDILKQLLKGDVGVAQVTRRLFQDCFPRNDVLASEPYFLYGSGCCRAAPALEEYRNSPPSKPGDVMLKVQFIFHLLDKSLAADRDRVRLAIISSRDVSARSC
jgi:hypothetical protein